MADDDRFSNPVEARKKAMDYLARREHGRVELAAKLEKAGFDPDILEAAIAQLVEDGLQSDRRFAEAFVASRIGQGKGPVRIRAELRDRGIDDRTVAQGINAAEVDWFELAREVKRRKFGVAMAGDFSEKARHMRFLQYRGFEPDHIQAAVSDKQE